jgi:hypothetical protein
MIDVIAPPAERPVTNYPVPIDTEVVDGFFDHLPNRKCFALIAPAVLGQEPIEAAVGIVGALLLWQKQGESISIRQRRPTGSFSLYPAAV